MKHKLNLVLLGFACLMFVMPDVVAQVQQSGIMQVACVSGCSAGTPGQTTMANSSPVVIASNQSAIPVTGTFWQATQPVSGTVTANAGTGTFAVSGTFWQATQPVSIATAPALVNSTANIGIVRAVPSSCTQSTNFATAVAQVATGAGSTVTSTTTCVTFAYANNITNSPVTLRLADRQGTPVIWFGGNADFTIPANSNVRIPLEGVTFTSGMTAIAGTATAVNLQVNGLQ